jgi:hypothetical protein
MQASVDIATTTPATIWRFDLVDQSSSLCDLNVNNKITNTAPLVGNPKTNLVAMSGTGKNI